MGKSKIFALLFLGLIICLGAAGNSPQLSDARSRVVQVYQSQIGVREQPGNSGPEVEAYQASVGLSKGYAWCGAFVSWVMIMAQVSIPKGAAWAPSWFCQSRLIKHEKALPGDVFGIWFASKKRIAHVGFIDEAWNNNKNTILTVEGNTNEAGSREGDGVYRKRRSKKQIYQVSNWIDKQEML